MRNRKKDMIQFLEWMRNGIAFCTTWLFLLVFVLRYTEDMHAAGGILYTGTTGIPEKRSAFYSCFYYYLGSCFWDTFILATDFNKKSVYFLLLCPVSSIGFSYFKAHRSGFSK